MRPRTLPTHSSRPLIIAHRGASGLLPEQTIEAFELAVDQGADAIELDVVPTRDGVLLARHENELSATTNIAEHPEYSGRGATKIVEDASIAGWFSEDFTAAEIGMLRARQRFAFRDRSHDGRFAIPTLADVLDWRAGRGHGTGLFIEIKHPTYFGALRFDMASLVLEALKSRGVADQSSGIVLMSFEPGVLKELRTRCDLPLVQLLDAPDARPFDSTASADPRPFRDLLTPEGLAEIASYAEGVGPWKRLIVPAETGGGGDLRLGTPTSLITDAHAARLWVCSWTFRDDPQFLAADYGGDPRREYSQFQNLGIDAIITDFPGTAASAIS